jgi:hypothetical protein
MIDLHKLRSGVKVVEQNAPRFTIGVLIGLNLVLSLGAPFLLWDGASRVALQLTGYVFIYLVLMILAGYFWVDLTLLASYLKAFFQIGSYGLATLALAALVDRSIAATVTVSIMLTMVGSLMALFGAYACIAALQTARRKN